MNDEALYKVFEFDESDLFNNRNGMLSTNQQARLADADRFAKKLGLVGVFFFLAVAIIPALIIGITGAHCISDLCAEEWPSSLRVFLLLLLLTWTPVWAWISIRLFISANTPYRIPALLKVEGPVNIVKVEGYNSASKTHTENYELRIGGETFDVDSELADIMMQGDVYAVYYIKEAMQIMSAEPIAKSK